MAEFVGRSGADAVFKALKRICIVIVGYGPKLQVAIDLAHAASLITTEQRATAIAFVASAQGVCDIFNAVASNSGF
jgi:hypothetical protein